MERVGALTDLSEGARRQQNAGQREHWHAENGGQSHHPAEQIGPPRIDVSVVL